MAKEVFLKTCPVNLAQKCEEHYNKACFFLEKFGPESTDFVYHAFQWAKTIGPTSDDELWQELLKESQGGLTIGHALEVLMFG